MSRGYDNERVNQMLVLDLQFRETTGSLTADFAKPYHADPTLTGAPAWAVLGNDLTYLSFDAANPDYISIAAADCADLDYTSGDFSGGAWVYATASGNRYLMNKGTNVTGWAFGILPGGAYTLGFYTKQAGPTLQTTYSGAITASTWTWCSFARDGASCRIYVNGRDRTTTVGAHVNPASSAAQNFYIGCNDLAAAGWYDGRMWRPRIWKRALTAPEMLAIYEAERNLFGV